MQEINNKILQLVIDIMKEKTDFDNIFKKLKNEFKANKNQSNTREIVVKWYIVLFKNFDTDLIDSNRDIYVTVIDAIDFNFPTLVQLQIDLICMLSVKNEVYFREIMKILIQTFHNNKKEINQDKLNQITNCLCNSI